MESALDSSEGRPTRLGEIARLFLKLGTIGFGGPAAHIALMEDEVVHRRRWLTREAFLDYVGATNLIPGPNSTELAIGIGRTRGGWPGLVVAGVSFIVPAALIVTLIAWVYVRFGQLPASLALLAGVKPVVVVIVAQALWRLGRSAIKSVTLAVLAAGAAVAILLGVHELLVLLGAAAVAVIVRATGGRAQSTGAVPSALMLRAIEWPAAATLGTAVTAASVSLGTLFAVFLKIGSVLFGSGYVLLAFLRADFVERLGWITERQLLDAVAVGQVTPGPVFTTATFIGYLLAGVPGAVVATVGIFLPAFIFVAISGSLIPRLRSSRLASTALDGVNAASLALMAVVTWQLGRAAVLDVQSALIAVGAAVVLATRKVNAAWLVLAGGLVGVTVAWFR